jgi:RsiW-degrading membrane proteinase PrsW (M82 family)
MDLMTNLLAIIVSILASVLPAIAYVLIIWWGDRYEKEPLGLLAIAFLWGAVPAVLISIVVELAFGEPLAALQAGRLTSMVESAALAPLIEELAKGLALLGLFIFVRRELDDILDGIVYGALVGVGFGMTENLLYFTSAFSDGGWGALGAVVFLRSVLFGLNHAFFTAFTGLGLGWARLAPRGWRRVVFPLTGLAASILFHALHNAGITFAETSPWGLLISLVSNAGGILVLLVVVLLAWRKERLWIAIELQDEVDRLVTSEEHSTAALYGRRVRLWASSLSSGGWREARRQGRLHHLLTELALRKHQVRVLDSTEEEDLRLDIDRLRNEIVALRESA